MSTLIQKVKRLILVLTLAFGITLKAQIADSLDIKIGQMIMVGINDRTALAGTDALIEELKTNKVGGIVIFEKNISKTDSKAKLKQLISSLKSNSPIPLFVSIDEEGGNVHRLKEKYGFNSMPSANYLGQLDNVDSTLFYNRRLAMELAELGFNLNYAPSVDLAVDSENTVLVKRKRCFSNDPDIVYKHALLCIKAHHENKVKTVLKHFPGHGSSTGDSHFGVVDVSKTWTFEELLPYYHVFLSNDCDAVMTAHIINRNWDTTLLPATLSKKVVTDILRNLMGFKGVIFSDDMQMHAISRNYGFEKALEMAINSGIDVLMFANNVSPKDTPITATEVHAKIKQLVKDGKISEQRITEAFKRIMILKNKTW